MFQKAVSFQAIKTVIDLFREETVYMTGFITKPCLFIQLITFQFLQACHWVNEGETIFLMFFNLALKGCDLF